MIVAPESNPYQDAPPGNPLLLSLAEVPVAAMRLKQSIEQREVDTGSAQRVFEVTAREIEI